METFDLKSIPWFPPWCVVPPVEKRCTALGITVPCVAMPVNDDIFSQEVVIGHWLTTLALIGIGLINLSYVELPFSRSDTTKIITSFYSIVTGVFASIRLHFGVSRFLLMAAAVHNLAEWALLMMIAAVNKSEADIEKYIKYFVFYIYAIIVLVVMMPTLEYAVLVEQSTGITIDYVLAFVFVVMYVKNFKNPDVKDFYFHPMIAHTVHLLFTILPLVFANFHIGYTSWYNSFYLETAVYISAPITHILYMVWSFDFDKKRSIPDKKDKTGQIPSELRVHNLKAFIGAGLICGLLTVIGIPLALGLCPTVPTCTASREVIGTAVANVHPGFDLAFEDYIHSQQLESKAHAFKGNKGYSVVKNLMQPHTYHFVERWASKEDLDAWIEQVGREVFGQPAVVNLLVNGHLHNLTAYENLQPSSCRNATFGGLSIQVESSCDKVWSVVSDWSDCSWITGCKYAIVDPMTNYRTLYNDDGSTLDVALRKEDQQDHELVYEVMRPSGKGGADSVVGYVATMDIGETGSEPKCVILYEFSIPKATNALHVDEVYQDFFSNRIRALQAVFSN